MHRHLALLSLLCALTACSQDNPVPNTPAAQTPLHAAELEVSFTLKIENLSQETALETGFSPLVWAVAAEDAVLLRAGQPAGQALERLAEDGNPDPLLAALTPALKGKLATALAPGQSSSFSFKAKPGMKLSFASMLAQSNDLFVTPARGQLVLFGASGEPIEPGAIALTIWDAGTEVNQEPGKGPDQAPRQAGPDSGTREQFGVRELAEVQDGFSYPQLSQLLRVSLSHDHEHDDHDDQEHDDYAR
ncbi:MAG: hypothetical protein CVV27_04270 [Candidatus Melainabacteria bacterium HGW-Melainabacteria-1]|nr:MAG: hypothetical protein CVV27_04270 [Candidatus Melainabacteria bacterium HGW-Melainabacteria-1]